MKDLFFKDWESIWHVIICASISYIALFIFIRISGKRTLAKLNAFDFVVTVTLGSTLSFMILAEISIAEGLTSLIIIIALQYLLAYGAKKSHRLEKIINCAPTLLFYNGKFIEDAMTLEVITEEEVYAEIRRCGLENLSDVRAVVMELNGEISVIKKALLPETKTSLEDIDLEKHM